MAEFTLYIGNKCFSSWSLRPWVAMKHLEIPFDEVFVRLRECGVGDGRERERYRKRCTADVKRHGVHPSTRTSRIIPASM